MYGELSENQTFPACVINRKPFFLIWPNKPKYDQCHGTRDQSAWPQKSIWRRELLIP